MGVKGYKVFNPDWTCRDFQYEVGKTYTHDGPIAVCEAGFHFCQKLSECFNYYKFDSSNHVAEIEANGNVITANGKLVTNVITIVREIPWHEVLELVNKGKNCTGYRNTGDHNTGDWNTGDWNTGDWNTGDRNTGDWNTGYGNTGDHNTGDHNTGDWNTGNWNTGDWNVMNNSSGFFNTMEPPIMAFNKPLKMSRYAFINSIGVRLLHAHIKTVVWVLSKDMNDVEKKEHPEHSSTGGYLKVLDFKTACRQMWDSFTDGERQAVREIPNFDPDVFEEITGIDTRK